jgi:hypothetical protein
MYPYGCIADYQLLYFDIEDDNGVMDYSYYYDLTGQDTIVLENLPAGEYRVYFENQYEAAANTSVTISVMSQE